MEAQIFFLSSTIQIPDPNVQFFGAHIAQVKIMRDW
jgi:hypothetical protein